jgi:hypothetical protein
MGEWDVAEGAGAVTRNRWVIAVVVLNDCRGVVVRANVIGVVVVGRQGRLNKLWIPNDDRFVFVDQWNGWWRSGKNAWCWWRERCNLAE